MSKIKLKWTKAINAEISDDEADALRKVLGIWIYRNEEDFYFCNREVTPDEFDEIAFSPTNPKEYLLGTK